MRSTLMVQVSFTITTAWSRKHTRVQVPSRLRLPKPTAELRWLVLGSWVTTRGTTPGIVSSTSTHRDLVHWEGWHCVARETALWNQSRGAIGIVWYDEVHPADLLTKGGMAICVKPLRLLRGSHILMCKSRIMGRYSLIGMHVGSRPNARGSGCILHTH
jgi:hypothetical protein